MLPRLLVAFLILTPALNAAQQTPEPLIPVTCRTAQDTANPPHPPAPHDPPPVTQAEALAIDQAGRKQPGFLSIPEQENFGIVRYRLTEYATCTDSSRCYWTDLQSQLTRARTELIRLVATRKSGEKLALVLDIDETSLSSYCELRREGFGFFAEKYNDWLTSPDASVAIPGTLELYRQALASDVSVFFITGRSHEMYEATARNLHLAGYDKWAGLTLRSEDERTMDTTWYKSSEREKIVKKGYRLILSVGDQWSDLNGSPAAEVSVKLPNPFYFLP